MGEIIRVFNDSSLYCEGKTGCDFFNEDIWTNGVPEDGDNIIIKPFTCITFILLSLIQ